MPDTSSALHVLDDTRVDRILESLRVAGELVAAAVAVGAIVLIAGWAFTVAICLGELLLDSLVLCRPGKGLVEFQSKKNYVTHKKMTLLFAVLAIDCIASR
jgi:hypothetical protein